MTLKPPGTLVRYIKEGRCVVFVGAGLSAGAKLPTWSTLLTRIIDAAAHAFPGGDAEVEELRRLVERGKLLEVADHCKERLGSSFHMLLTEQLRGDTGELPETFRLLMRIPFSAWVTTNYDKLLERAYSEVLGGFPRVLTHMDTEPLGRLLFDGGKFILKAHGDIDRHGTVVLTSRDYADIIHANPSFNAVFSSLLLTRALLFVGYSLSDPDFRLLMDRQFTAFKGFVPDRYALMGGMGQVEQDVLWRTARIRVLPYPEGQHGEVLNFLQALEEAVNPEARTAPAAPPPGSASPGGVRSSVLLKTLGSPEKVEDADETEPSAPAPRFALAFGGDGGGMAAPRSVPPEMYQLTMNVSRGEVLVQLLSGEKELLLLEEGRVPLHALSALPKCADILNAERSIQYALPLIRRAFTDCLPGDVWRGLHELVRMPGRLSLILRPSRELERLPWELLPVQGEWLCLRAALTRAPVGIAEAARGRPRVHTPARLLLVGPSEEDRDVLERLTGIHADARASACERLGGSEAVPERVLERLEAGAYDFLSLAGRAGFSLNEPSLALHGGAPLAASTLRPVLDRSPPAFMMVDAASSAFQWSRDGFLRLATETGVGAFIGGFGTPARAASETFQRRLHQGLAGGETVAEAVLQARLETHRAFPDEPTPLQYVLSGSGDLRLR